MNKINSQKRKSEEIKSFSPNKKRKTFAERRCERCRDIFANLDNYIDKTDPLYFRLYGWTKEYHQTCWNKIEAQQAENEKKCREEQARIIANFQAKGMSSEQQAQMENEEDTIDLEEYSYPHESEVKENDLIYWKEHQAQNKENNKTLTSLIIKPNKYRFESNSLTIDGEYYLNLKILYACGLGLGSINLSNIPKLEALSLINNLLKKVGGLENLTNLVSLTLAKNCLQSLDFRKNVNLKSLIVNNNSISSSKPRIWVKVIDCSGLKDLEYLDCSFNLLHEIKIEGCENLKTLDADGNSFNNLNFPYLPNLENLSLLSNGYGKTKNKTLTLQSPNLKFLVIRGSNIKKVVHKLGLNKELQVIDDETYERLYNSTEEAIQGWEREVDQTITNSNLDESIRNLFGDTHIDHEKEKKNREEARKDAKNIPLCSYPLPTNKKGVKEISIPHKGLTGRIEFKDYPDLEHINVGNNDLQAIEIDNCPELWWLIYSHNDLIEPEAKISRCPKLTDEHINKEHCQGGWERPELTEEERKKWDEQMNEKWEREREREREREKICQQAKALLDKLEQGENNAFAEFINTYRRVKNFEPIFDSLNKESQEQFKKTFVPKLEEKLKELIDNFSKEKQGEFLTEVDKLMPFKVYFIEESKQRLEKLLKSLVEINSEATSSNYKSLMISCGILSLLLITSLFYYWIKQIKHKNKKK
ncbi:MAG: hypothetical protein mread185_000345 [Mycoplasmataceae bacterium]|nr:MAG: hypothetical protein mread185_000345 [Mycoplasmataceae bacterium]